MKRVISKRQQILMTLVAGLFSMLAVIDDGYGQAALQAWGNLSGIRVQGQLMPFESSLRVVGTDWMHISATGKEKQQPGFRREGDQQIVVTKLGSIRFTETVTDLAAGKASVMIGIKASSDTTINGSFFCITIPLDAYSGGTLTAGTGKPLMLSSISDEFIVGHDISINSAAQHFHVAWKESDSIFVKPVSIGNKKKLDLYIPIKMSGLRGGDSITRMFMLEASGKIDQGEVHLALDASKTGRPFAGLGGNFRIQNLQHDPSVIDYCLNNLRVAWGRVEMPWRFWQPDQRTDPVAAAKSGHLDDHVRRAMEMAQRLQQKGIPIILTDWFAPNWAIVGSPVFRHVAGMPWGNPLNPDSANAIYQSIADYIQYLKDEYKVDIGFFSFNESDLGINVRQTGEEHDQLIKGLGAYFESRHLKTKLLLGDNSDATTYSFIDPALADDSSHSFIGAVSFHSWRGWETETLNHWAVAASKLNLPLIVGEGSIDAAAYAYPNIFLEQIYALEEINLYIRLLAIVQPVSILQWQLTSDYSPLSGGGMYGKEGPLMPTQRFWNLKQLAETPEGLLYMPITCDREDVTAAALGDRTKKKYLVHLVNNGAARTALLTGIPAGMHSVKITSTSKTASLELMPAVTVNAGKAAVRMPAVSFITLTIE